MGKALSGKAKLLVLSQLKEPGVLKKLYLNSNYYYNSTGHISFPHLQPEDIVHTAIEMLLDDDQNRSFDPSKCNEVESVIRGIVKSIYNNEYRRKKNKEVKIVTKNPDGSDIDLDSFPNEKHDDSTSNNIYSEIRNAIEKVIDGHDDLLEIYFLMLEGCFKPKELAKELGVSVKDINNRIRKLRRKFANLKEERKDA